MPYALKNRCVIRADTGAIVKCHRTRARALKHLAALQINVPEMKADAERTPMTRAEAARHASLVRWKKESALAPQTGGMSNPKIRARVAEILAAAQKKTKPKTKGGKGKKGPDPAKAKAAAERKAKSAAAKQEREKAKLARNAERTAKQAARETAHKQKVAERATAAQAKQQARQAKLKQAAAKQKAKAGASAAKEKSKTVQAKPAKEAAEPAKKQADNRAKVAKDMADQDAGLAPGGAAALNDFADGKPLKEETAKQFESMGLVEKGIDGTHRLTSEGRAAANAMSKGDTRGTIDAISRAADKKKSKGGNAKTDKEKDTQEKADRDQGDLLASIADNPKKLGYRQAGDLARAGLIEKTPDGYRLTDVGKAKIAKRQKEIDAAKSNAGKAINMSELAIKAGARHSATDMQHIQAIHDSSVACGANCDTGDGYDGDEMDMDGAEKAIKGIMDDPGYYAQHECGDIMQAANALSTMAMLIQSELAEEDEDTAHITMLCDAAHTLVDFIDSELDELEQAAKDDAAEDATIGHEPMKAITAREDVSPADKKRAVAEYGDVDYADEKNKKYPLDTPDHIRAANSYIGQEKNAAKYSADEVATIKRKIIAAWKKKIDPAGPPSAGKAWGLEHIEGEAIKALDNDVIRGYAVRFGDADHADLQRDYYTKSTDFWLDHFGWPRPITYHHGMDAGTRNDPVIGHWLKAGVDDVGVWMEGQMDRAHAYYKAMKELAQRGYLRLSSDSAPQWVIREKQQNGVSEIKRWPLVTSSVTVTPMEPRMLPVEVKAFLAELGFEGIDDSQEAIDPELARSDETKASDDERARVLLLELELLELELETA